MKNKETKLVNELFELWKNFAKAGELSIGYGFSENYNRLRDEVLILNKVAIELNDKHKTVIEELEKDLKEWDKLNDEGKLNNEKWLRHHAFVKGKLSILYTFN